MTSRTRRSFNVFGLVLALIGALWAANASAARLHDFGLTQVWSECSAPGRYNVRMTFRPVADTTTYSVASGNKCQLRSVVCGISSGGCTTTCAGPGPCEVVLSQCQQGRGGSWVGISAPGRVQRAATAAPQRCL